MTTGNKRDRGFFHKNVNTIPSVGVLFFVLSGHCDGLVRTLQLQALGRHQILRKTSHTVPVLLRDMLNDDDFLAVDAENEPMVNPEVASLKRELLIMSTKTNRGFQAKTADRDAIKDIIYELSRFNSSKNPARGYYDNADTVEYDDDSDAISGKWTLIYTDAPDITSLDTSRNPLATAKLGRIGQECSPPYIKNVIEWLRPDWAGDFPFSGSAESRVLQKVVTLASASPSKPMLVDLKVGGLELESGYPTQSSTTNDGLQDLVQRVQDQGLPAGLLSLQPLDLKGPWNPPFGRFEILYVDKDIRIIRTGQNYLAANQRIQNFEDEWF
ncbi:plastid lipid-associated PAP/fibrillin family protein [Nitzschia inconspicua]|uniref:Plastid lipid-associated PAP/fibrillin family protein n=1 Tax=Nitzschia inconspicua TaxID=303405 RepID=A0A9K3KE72_9STRA|nr:plastid lipid-associated PAP/fibrillin family protein [Nitzschia inconspicua]